MSCSEFMSPVVMCDVDLLEFDFPKSLNVLSVYKLKKCGNFSSFYL